MKAPSSLRSIQITALFAFGMPVAIPLAAQTTTTYTWTGGASEPADSRNWDVAENWNVELPNYSNESVLNFNIDMGDDILTYLGLVHQIRGIDFGSELSNADGIFRLRTRAAFGGTVARNLLFNNGGSGDNAFISVDADSTMSRVIMSQGNVGVVALQTDLDFFHNSSDLLFQFDGNVTGQGSLNKYGVGAMTLTRNNSFDGLNVYGGSAVAFATPTSLGAGQVTLGESGSANDASLYVGSNLVYANDIVVNSGSGVRQIGNTDVATQTGSTLAASAGNAELSGSIDLSAGKDVTFNVASFEALTTDRLNVSGDISGSGGVVKTGDGILRITGTNTYTGDTTVSEGVFLVDGSLASDSELIVTSDSVFGGDGTIGDLTLESGALFAFDTANTLDLEGILTLDSSFGVGSLRDLSGGAINWTSIADGTYTLLEGDNLSVFGSENIANFGLENAFDIGNSRIAYFQNGSLQLVVIPEPSVYALISGLLVFMGVLQRRLR